MPAYFNVAQRQAAKTPVCAGLSQSASSTNRPLRLAFGMDKQERGDRKIAVYDLGGGTFDVSIIEIADVDGEKRTVLSTSDTFLGGEDFDQRILTIVTEFRRTRR
jgi:molecular chaperone DnaK